MALHFADSIIHCFTIKIFKIISLVQIENEFYNLSQIWDLKIFSCISATDLGYLGSH